MTSNENSQGGHWVFTRSIRLKNGRVIFPKKGKVFRFWAKPK